MSYYLYGFVVGLVPAFALAVCLLVKRSFDEVVWE